MTQGKDLGALVGQIGADIRQWEKAANQVNKDMRGMAKQGQSMAAKVQASLDRMGKGMQSAGRTLNRRVTLPLVGLGSAALKVGSDFESSFSKIQGLVGVSAQEVGKLRSAVLDMGGDVAQTPNELGEALFFVTSAGLRGQEALDVLHQSAKAATAGLGDTKTVADLVTSAVNAYGADTLSAANATDVLTASVREGKAEAPELASSLGQVLPIASNMGVTFNEVGAAVAAMTRTGTNASTAAMQLRQILAKLLKPMTRSEEAARKMGKSVGEFRDMLRGPNGLVKVLSFLREQMQTNEQAMVEIFPNIRALSGALDIMGNNADENVKIFERMQDSTGTMGEAFGAVEDDIRTKVMQAFSDLQSEAIRFSEILMPLAKRVLDFSRQVMESIRTMSQEVREKVIMVAGLFGASGPILTALGIFLQALAAISWPVVLGIAGFASATAAIINNWDHVLDYFTKGGGKGLLNSFRNLFDAISGLIIAFSSNWQSDVVGVISKTMSILSDRISTGIDVMSGMVFFIQGDWTRAWASFQDAATSNMEELDKAVFLNMGNMAQSIIAVTNVLTGDWATAWEQYKHGFFGMDSMYSDFQKRQEQMKGSLDETTGIMKAGNKVTDTTTQMLKNMGQGYGILSDKAQEASKSITKANEKSEQSGEGDGFTMPEPSGMLPSTPIEKPIDELFAFTPPTEMIQGLEFDKFFPSVDELQKGIDFSIPDKMFPPGSLGYLKERLNELQQRMQRATNPKEIQRLQESMAGTREEMDALTQGATESGKAISGVLRTIDSIFQQAVLHGRNLGNVLGKIVKQLASKALINGLAMLVSGGSFGLGKMLFGSVGSIIGVGDALIRDDGSVVKFHPDDDILAMKDFSQLGIPDAKSTKGQRQEVLQNHLYIDGREVEIALEDREYGRNR